MISEYHKERRYRFFIGILIVLAVWLLVFPCLRRDFAGAASLPDAGKKIFNAPVIPFAPLPATEPVTGVPVIEKKPFDDAF